MVSTLTIPKLCKVGFNPREDTYTGKLGYVIYNDGKVWRKEASWSSWIYNIISKKEFEAKKLESFNQALQNGIAQFKKISESENRNKEGFWEQKMLETYPTQEQFLKGYYRIETIKNYYFQINRSTDDVTLAPFEFDNEPTEGFVLNKKAGGHSSGWNHRQSYIRVYDPRGFEFEITPENLLYILEHTNSIVGKGLEGKFLYSWCGKDLVLLPANAPEYAESIKYSTFVKQKVSSKILQVGGVYLDSQKQKLVYLTRDYSYSYDGVQSDNQQYWFARLDTKDPYPMAVITTIKEFTGEILEDTTDYFEKLVKNKYYAPTEKFVPEYIEATEENLNKYFGKSASDTQSKIINDIYLHTKNRNGTFKKATGSYLTYDYSRYGSKNPRVIQLKDPETKNTFKKTYQEIELENKYYIKLKKQVS